MTLKHRVMLSGLLVALCAFPALAVPPGHVTDTVGALHFNIDNVKMFGNGAAPVLVGPPSYVGGACGTAGGASSLYACGFGDGLGNAATPWAWETAIQNTNAGVMTANVGFFYPFGGPLLGTLTLGPGSTFHVGIIVNDALIGDVGNKLIWYSWRKPGFDILTSAAVIEGAHAVPYVGPGDGIANTHGEFWYHFHSGALDNFVVNPNLDPSQLDFAFMDPNDEDRVAGLGIPEPSAMALLSLALLGALGCYGRRR